MNPQTDMYDSPEDTRKVFTWVDLDHRKELSVDYLAQMSKEEPYKAITLLLYAWASHETMEEMVNFIGKSFCNANDGTWVYK